MVCIACFIAPVILFIYYKFIYPLLQPLIDRFIGNYQLPQIFGNLSCPLPQKKSDKAASCPMAAKQSTGDASTGGEAASTGEDDKKMN
jgi:hypothetical protein